MKSIVTNYWARIIFALCLGVISAFSIALFCSLETQTIPVAVGFGTYGVIVSVLDGLARLYANREVDQIKKQILSEFCVRKIDDLRGIMNSGRETITIAYHLNVIEDILTEIWKCCHKDEKPAFQDFKGKIGDAKTTVEKLHKGGKSLPVTNIFDILQEVRSGLKEL